MIDRTQVYPIRFFVQGHEYRFIGLFPSRLHLMGVNEPGAFFPLGTDRLGRDMYSRVLQGARVSLSIGLVGVAISFVLGCLLGGASGFFGGTVDMIVQRIIDWMLYSPKDYLSKWHIAYNEDANTVAKEEGFENWGEAFNHHASIVPTHDLDRPRIDPWMFTEQTTTIRAYVRNPFFHQVDQAGNQLPYVDKIVSELVEKETYDLKIIVGEADIAFLSATLDNYTLYKQNEEAGNYVVKLIPGVEGNEAAYGFNLNHPDPVRRELCHNLKFRQAMSLGIDRDEVNRVALSGLPHRATRRCFPAPATTRRSGRRIIHMPATLRTRPTACWTSWA